MTSMSKPCCFPVWMNKNKQWRCEPSFQTCTTLSDWLPKVSGGTVGFPSTRFMCAVSVTTHVQCESWCHGSDPWKKNAYALEKKKHLDSLLSWNLNFTLAPPLPWQGQAGSRNSSRPLIWRLHSGRPGKALPLSPSLSASLPATLPAWLSTAR